MNKSDFFDGIEQDPDLLRFPDESTTQSILEISEALLREQLTREETIMHLAVPIPELWAGEQAANLLVLHASTVTTVDEGESPEFYFGIGNTKDYVSTHIFNNPLLSIDVGREKYWLEKHLELKKQSALDLVKAMGAMFADQRLKTILGELREQIEVTTFPDSEGLPHSLVGLELVSQRFIVGNAILELLEREDTSAHITTITVESRHIPTAQGGVYILQETRLKQPGYKRTNVIAESTISEEGLKFNHVQDEDGIDGYTISLEPLEPVSKRRLSDEVAGYEYTLEQFESELSSYFSAKSKVDYARSPNEYMARAVLNVLRGLTGAPNN